MTGEGLAVAQAVSRRHLTAEAQVVSPSGTWGGQNGTGTGFSPIPLGFPCQYLPTAVPYSLICHLGDEQRVR
jgi:hypothetical protein